MEIANDEWASVSANAERTFQRLTVAGVLFLLTYLVATVAGVPAGILSPVFAVAVIPLPVVAWWGYTRAVGTIKRPIGLLAAAATLWLAGSAIWQATYVSNGDHVPGEPGVWDACFVPALLLVVIALVVALRSVISFELAVLDATVIVAAGVGLAAPFVVHGLRAGVTGRSLFELNRPVLSVVALMLVASAAMGSRDGIPRSMLTLGFSALGLMVGNLIFSYREVEGTYVDDRWANLAWASGAVAAILTACVVVLRIDRPVYVRSRNAIPNSPLGSEAVLLVSLAALSLTLAAACYGLVHGSKSVTAVGIATSAAIGVAMALRARNAIHATAEAYKRLDRSLAETERARDDLFQANTELGRANAEIQALHIAFADLLNLADRRTQGQIRSLIEDAGEDLLALLEEQLPPRTN